MNGYDAHHISPTDYYQYFNTVIIITGNNYE